MKTIKILLASGLVLLAGFQLTPPGIRQSTIWLYAPSTQHVGGTILLVWYTDPFKDPVKVPAFISRNTAIATVDKNTGRVRGASPGITWVRGQFFDSKKGCLFFDSVKVTVARRPLL